MFNFHPDFSSLGVAALLGSIAGWIIVLLPTIIAAIKRSTNIVTVLLLNTAYLLVAEILTWLSYSFVQMNRTLAIVLVIINFVALWGAALVFAIKGKPHDDSRLDDEEDEI